MTADCLRIENVSVTRGGTRIIDEASLELGGGQIVAVIGPNGAGKSTLLAAVAGQIAHAGRILWQDDPVVPGRIGYLPQASDVRSGLTVLEAVMLGRYDCLSWRLRQHDVAATSAVLAELGLAHLAGRLLPTLSGGQRQLVLLAQRLIRKPKLLILDEATSALDLRHQMMVLDILQRYVAQTGALVVMAIHDINLAIRHADMLVLMAGGRIAAAGTPRQVVSCANMRAFFGVDIEISETTDGRMSIIAFAASASWREAT